MRIETGSLKWFAKGELFLLAALQCKNKVYLKGRQTVSSMCFECVCVCPQFCLGSAISDDEWFVSFYQPATKPTTHIALVIHPMIYKYPILYSYSGLRLIIVIATHQYPIKRWMEESFAPVDDVINPIDIGFQPSRCGIYSIHSITTAGPFPMISRSLSSRRFEYWPLGRTWKAIQFDFNGLPKNSIDEIW